MSKAMSDLRVEMQSALESIDNLVESARLLGVTQAKKGYGYYTQQDSRMERAWHESIAKYSRTLRAALVEQDAEPVAWLCKRDDGFYDVLSDSTCTKCFPVYTATPSHEWKTLNDKEIIELIPDGDAWKYEVGFEDAIEFARTVEKWLKEKNHG